MKQTEQQETKKFLLKLFSPDLKKGELPIVYTICKHVSNSGMMRHIDIFFIGKDRKPINLNWYIEKLGLYKRGSCNSNNSNSLRVSGCGMDMGFDVVYNLGETLTKELIKYEIIIGRNGDKKPETSGGYLLNQRWL